MAALTKEQVEEYNRQQLETIKNSGPGTYEINYKYYNESTGGTYSFPYTIRLGDIDNNACINYNGPGGGGVNTDINNYLDNSTHNSIDISYGSIAIRNTGGVTSYYNATSSLIDDIADVFETDKNVLYDGHSYSADFVNHMAANYASNHESDNLYILCMEPDANYEITEKERQALINSNAIVINAFSQNVLYRRKQGYNSSYEGLHTLDIKINTEGYDGGFHGLPVSLLTEYGITNIANGTFDFNDLPDAYNFNGTIYNLTYDFVECYYNENNEYVRVEYHVDPNNREALSELNYSICSTVMSDADYLAKQLSRLNSLINNSKEETIFQNYSSNTIIPTIEPSVVNATLSNLNKLLDKLSKEIASIISIGESINNVDIDLANIADTLGMEINSTLVDEVELLHFDDESTIIIPELETPIIDDSLNDDTNQIEDIKVTNDQNNNVHNNPIGFNKENNDTEQKNIGDDEEVEIIDLDYTDENDSNDTIENTIVDEETNSESVNEEQIIPIENIEDETIEENVNFNIEDAQTREENSDILVADDLTIKDDTKSKVISSFEKEKVSKEKNPINQSFQITEDIVDQPINNTDNITQRNQDIIVIENNEDINSDVYGQKVSTYNEVNTSSFLNISPDNEVINENTESLKNNTNTLKSAGIIAGIGLGLGTSAYGINNQIKNKDNQDGYEYSYSDDKEKDEYSKKEVNTNEYTPYTEYTNEEGDE